MFYVNLYKNIRLQVVLKVIFYILSMCEFWVFVTEYYCCSNDCLIAFSYVAAQRLPTTINVIL